MPCYKIKYFCRKEYKNNEGIMLFMNKRNSKIYIKKKRTFCLTSVNLEPFNPSKYILYGTQSSFLTSAIWEPFKLSIVKTNGTCLLSYSIGMITLGNCLMVRTSFLHMWIGEQMQMS